MQFRYTTYRQEVIYMHNLTQALMAGFVCEFSVALSCAKGFSLVPRGLSLSNAEFR